VRQKDTARTNEKGNRGVWRDKVYRGGTDRQRITVLCEQDIEGNGENSTAIYIDY